MFNNMNLSDYEVLKIMDDYKSLINKYSYINGVFDEDLNQEIKYYIYKQLTVNRKK